ncbi:MAG: HTH domain-containing protein, partial [Sphaerochaetaceae bacterium]|nr:HTH domain-containing protein [Sphaerochaetaceae bacterium]
MNHELSSASVLAERFGVSVRTIVRDIETIDAAGIPIVSIQGPHGGYRIMDTYTLDNRIVSVEDLYYIVTSLKSISDTLVDEKIDDTIEKMEGLIP